MSDDHWHGCDCDTCIHGEWECELPKLTLPESPSTTLTTYADLPFGLVASVNLLSTSIIFSPELPKF